MSATVKQDGEGKIFISYDMTTEHGHFFRGLVTFPNLSESIDKLTQYEENWKKCMGHDTYFLVMGVLEAWA